MTETKRIAYLCLEAQREGQAVYVHVKEIIDGLERRGWKVDLFRPSYSDCKAPPLIARLLDALRQQAGLCWCLRSYDVLYVRAHPMAFPIALVARVLGLIIVHEINGTWKDLYVANPTLLWLARFLNFGQRLQYRWAVGLITVTPELAEWLGAVTAPRTPPIVVIPNGANIELFIPGAFTDITLPDRYAVFFGGLTRWHGIDVMLAALASGAWPADVSLVVLGKDGEFDALRARAETDPRLVLLGRLPYADVPGVVCRALAGLAPISDPDGRSSSAGLAPLKVFETLACGIPAIVSDFPYQAELVREGRCGLVVPPDDGPALAQAVAELAGNREKAFKMGQRGRRLICAEHSWDRRASDTAAFLKRLIQMKVRKPV